MLSRFAVAAYAVVSYAIFVLSVAWSAVFLAGGIDGPATTPAWAAVVINGALLLAFAVHHTLMARPAVKQRLTRYLPAAAERSTYVLVASLLLIALFAFWQPIPAVLWHVGMPWSIVAWTLFAIGWAVTIGSTFLVDHADFLGLKQAYRNLRRQPHTPPPFKNHFLYAWVRHPMMLGLLITFWATPHMTAGHLFFAVSATAYIVIGIRFEEKDLRTELGPQYTEYARRVPALLPLVKP